MDRCIAPDMTTSFFTRSVYVKTYRAEILSFWGFKSDVVSISYYCTTILHKCAMCYAKIKRGFFLTIVAQFQFLLYVLLPNYFP